MAKGAEEFTRRLAKVPAAVRKAASAAHLASAKEWVKEAKRFAPDDPKTQGQDLRASIRHNATNTGGQEIRAGGATTTVDGYDYALAQEFGTSEMPASPYYWTSYRLLRKRFDSRRRRAVNKAIKEIFNG